MQNFLSVKATLPPDMGQKIMFDNGIDTNI